FQAVSFGEDSNGSGVVVRIFVPQFERVPLSFRAAIDYAHRRPARRIDIPVRGNTTHGSIIERIVDRLFFAGSQSGGNAGDPNIFFIHTVREPDRAVGRSAIALFDAAR